MNDLGRLEGAAVIVGGGKPGDPRSAIGTPMRTMAAELVSVLYDEGISHLFVNPDMYTPAVRAALAQADADNVSHPRPVLCGHEHLALYAAHGHHLVSGSPQAVMVHVEGAQLDLDRALENAVRDRVPLILLSGGSAPVSPNGVPTPRTIRPGLEKWSSQTPATVEFGALIRRASQIARAEPGGLAHVPLCRDSLAEPASASSRRLATPRLPLPDPTVLEDMAELLAAAESPAIIAGRVGRNLAAVHELALLAEMLGAPVIDVRTCVNLPLNHPLNAAMEAPELLARADAVLLLDVEVPCYPGLGKLPPNAWVLQIDTECLKTNLTCWDCPVELSVTADTSRALPMLRALLADRLSPRQREVQERRGRLEVELQERRAAWRGRGASSEREDLSDAIMAELQRVLPDDALVFEEAHASLGGAMRQLERPPGHFFRTTARSAGWSVGAAMGARLARPGQPVVAVCDESAFESGLPTAAFWSAHRVGASFLTVVLDRTRRTRKRPGTRRTVDDAGFESDAVAVARSCGAEAKVVNHPNRVADAVERLLATTRDGVCAVLDARLPRV